MGTFYTTDIDREFGSLEIHFDLNDFSNFTGKPNSIIDGEINHLLRLFNGRFFGGLNVAGYEVKGSTLTISFYDVEIDTVSNEDSDNTLIASIIYKGDKIKLYAYYSEMSRHLDLKLFFSSHVNLTEEN